MKKSWRHIAVLLLLLMISFSGEKNYAQHSEPASVLPKVFMIGQNESAFEDLVVEHNNLLLTVCDDSMEVAYGKWTNLLREIDSYAKSMDYDINGVKIWINMFWNPDGSIKHIVYYPKPNSKNMDFEAFTLFLSDFAERSVIDLEFHSGFSHYGSASFPVFTPYYKAKDK